jgi:hypothetical protein
MYTVLAINGAFYVDAENASVVFDALREDRQGVTFRTAESAISATNVTVPVAEVLAVLAHDADENSDLRSWRSRRAKQVVSLADYLRRRGRTAVCSLT